MLLLLLACAGTKPTDTDGGADSPAACETTELGEVERYPGDEARVARTLTARITTTVDFDPDAEAVAHTDCSYTREYPLLTEAVDIDWVCPECTWYTAGLATVVEGYEDCYQQLSTAEAARVEHLGFVEGKDGLALWRSGVENVRMADTGARVDAAALAKGEVLPVAWTSGGPLDQGGTAALSWEGTISQGVAEDVVLLPPTTPRTEPYTCGWPTRNPGGPVEDWEAGLGEVFPDARLVDPCGELVDIWDFRGKWLVIDAASPDCGPCIGMAETAEAFKAQMAAECIEVETLTLLNAGLREVNLPPDDATLDAWVEQLGVAGPVLADRGFGYSVIAPYFYPEGGMSLPSVLILDPEGRLVGGDHGWSEDSGGWERYATILRAAAATRGE